MAGLQLIESQHDRGNRHPMGCGNSRLRDKTVHHVDASNERRLTLARFSQPEIRKVFNVAVGDVCQRLRGRARIGTRHVGHTIVSHSLLNEYRRVMRRWA